MKKVLRVTLWHPILKVDHGAGRSFHEVTRCEVSQNKFPTLDLCFHICFFRTPFLFRFSTFRMQFFWCKIVTRSCPWHVNSRRKTYYFWSCSTGGVFYTFANGRRAWIPQPLISSHFILLLNLRFSFSVMGFLSLVNLTELSFGLVFSKIGLPKISFGLVVTSPFHLVYAHHLFMFNDSNMHSGYVSKRRLSSSLNWCFLKDFDINYWGCDSNLKELGFDFFS